MIIYSTRPFNILLFCSHMLVESLGKVEPLSVHKMDPSRVLPEFDPDTILSLIQKVSNRVEYSRFARLSRLTGLVYSTSSPFPRMRTPGNPKSKSASRTVWMLSSGRFGLLWGGSDR